MNTRAESIATLRFSKSGFRIYCQTTRQICANATTYNNWLLRYWMRKRLDLNYVPTASFLHSS